MGLLDILLTDDTESTQDQPFDRRDFTRLKQAIFGQESGGNYNATNRTWNSARQRYVTAYGKSQVLDENIGPWTEAYYGKRLTPTEYLNNPEAQDTVSDGRLADYFRKNVNKYGNDTRSAIKETALDWYGRGKPDAGPSTSSYAHQVLNRFDKASGDESETEGQLIPGNIDLNKRPTVRNADGTISTVRSVTQEMGGKFYLVPTVADDGRIVSDDEANSLYLKTGKHLGVFSSEEAANRYAKTLHERQDRQYPGQYPDEPTDVRFSGLAEVLRKASETPNQEPAPPDDRAQWAQWYQGIYDKWKSKSPDVSRGTSTPETYTLMDRRPTFAQDALQRPPVSAIRNDKPARDNEDLLSRGLPGGMTHETYEPTEEEKKLTAELNSRKITDEAFSDIKNGNILRGALGIFDAGLERLKTGNIAEQTVGGAVKGALEALPLMREGMAGSGDTFGFGLSDKEKSDQQSNTELQDAQRDINTPGKIGREAGSLVSSLVQLSAIGSAYPGISTGAAFVAPSAPSKILKVASDISEGRNASDAVASQIMSGALQYATGNLLSKASQVGANGIPFAPRIGSAVAQGALFGASSTLEQAVESDPSNIDAVEVVKQTLMGAGFGLLHKPMNDAEIRSGVQETPIPSVIAEHAGEFPITEEHLKPFKDAGIIDAAQTPETLPRDDANYVRNRAITDAVSDGLKETGSFEDAIKYTGDKLGLPEETVQSILSNEQLQQYRQGDQNATNGEPVEGHTGATQREGVPTDVAEVRQEESQQTSGSNSPIERAPEEISQEDKIEIITTGKKIKRYAATDGEVSSNFFDTPEKAKDNFYQQKNGERYSVYTESGNGDPLLLNSFSNKTDAIEYAKENPDREIDHEDDDHLIYVNKELNDDGKWISSEDNYEFQYIYPRINKATDDILTEVQNNFGGKYSHISNDDGSVNLRIADHSGTAQNNNRYNYGEPTLSIVISNKNPTERFSHSEKAIFNEYYFDDSSTSEDISNFIKEKSDEILETKRSKEERLDKDISSEQGEQTDLGLDVRMPSAQEQEYFSRLKTAENEVSKARQLLDTKTAEAETARTEGSSDSEINRALAPYKDNYEAAQRDFLDLKLNEPTAKAKVKGSEQSLFDQPQEAPVEQTPTKAIAELEPVSTEPVVEKSVSQKELREQALSNPAVDVRSAILQYIAEGNSFSLKDIKRDIIGSDKKIGGKNSDYPMSYYQIARNSGISIDRFVHEELPVRLPQAEGLDEIEARNVVHDVLSSLSSRQDAINELTKPQQNETAQMEKAYGPIPSDYVAPVGPAELQHRASPAFSEVIPGAYKFIEQDIAPIFGGIKKGIADVVHLVAPRVGVEPKYVDMLMKLKGQRDLDAAKLHGLDTVFGTYFQKMTPAERIDFLDKYKRGEELSPDSKVVADFIKPLDKQDFEAVKEFNPSIEWKENHLRAIWKVIPDSLKKGNERVGNESKRPLSGTEGFLKKSTLPDVSEGLKRGGELITDNPWDLWLRGHEDVVKYVTAQRMIAEAKELGAVKFSPTEVGTPEGFVRIDDKIGRMYFKQGDQNGHWYAEEGFGRLLNNMLSVDKIRTSPWGRGLFDIKNHYTAFELSASPFHGIFETVEAAIDRMKQGLVRTVNVGIRQGKPVEALKGIAEIATSPLGPILGTPEGGAMKAYLERGAMTPEVEAFKHAQNEKSLPVIRTIKNWRDARKAFKADKFKSKYARDNADEFLTELFSGGIKLKDSDYSVSGAQGYLKAVDSNNYIGAFARMLPTANHYIMKPLFEEYIPRLKLGSMVKNYSLSLQDYAKELADGRVTKEQLARKAWDNVENVFGEMNFDNLFWNKTFKSTLQLVFRSVTWKGGTLRQIGTGVSGQAREFFNAIAQKGPEGYKFKPSIPRLDPRFAWLASMSFYTAAISAVTQKALYGKYPWETDTPFIDSVYPRVDEEGNRFSPWTYMKDIVGLAKHPGQFFVHSTAGVYGKAIEAFTNKDFFNVQIYDPNEDTFTQGWDIVKHIAPIPFSVTNLQKAESQHSTETVKTLNKIGWSFAPGYVTKTEAMQKAYDIQQKERKIGSTSGSDFEKLKVKSDIDYFLRHDNDEAARALAKKIGLLPKEYLRMRSSAKLPPLERAIYRFGLENAEEVYKAADDSERKQLLPHIERKIKNSKTLSDEAKAAKLQGYGLPPLERTPGQERNKMKDEVLQEYFKIQHPNYDEYQMASEIQKFKNRKKDLRKELLEKK